MDLEYYSDLSKKENALVLIMVYKDKAVHSIVPKEDFENIKDLRKLCCSELIASLNK